MTALSRVLVAGILLIALGGCGPKRLRNRQPDGGPGEAGASNLAAGAASTASGGRGGSSDVEDASASEGGASGSMQDASPPPVDAGALPGLPAPRPGIVSEIPLPGGIWIGETSQNLGDEACPVSSLRVTLQIDSAAPSGIARATIIFGDDVPVPPIDPAREYPQGASEARVICVSMSVLEGFPYTVHDGHMDAFGRLHFRVVATEPYAAWCAQKTSLPFREAPTGYTCLPYGLPRYRAMCASDPECSASLTYYALCDQQRACVCVEEGCRSNVGVAHRFDLELSATTLRGVISPVASQRGAIEVALRKVQ